MAGGVHFGIKVRNGLLETGVVAGLTGSGIFLTCSGIFLTGSGAFFAVWALLAGAVFVVLDEAAGVLTGRKFAGWGLAGSSAGSWGSSGFTNGAGGGAVISFFFGEAFGSDFSAGLRDFLIGGLVGFLPLKKMKHFSPTTIQKLFLAHTSSSRTKTGLCFKEEDNYN